MKLILLIPDQATFDAETRIARGVLFSGSQAGREITAATLPALRDVAPGDVDVVALVPSSRIVFIETALPNVAAAKRDQLVRYAIEDKLTIDPATVHAVVLGETEGGSAHHIVAAIDRRWLQSALTWLRDGGLTARLVLAENALLPVNRNEWSVLLGTRTPYARRADGFAFALDATSTNAPPFALTLALNEAKQKPNALALYANDAATHQTLTSDVLHHWQAALSLNVLRAEPFDFIARCKQLNAKSGNLLTGEFAPTRTSDAWVARLKPAAALAGVMLLCQFAFTVADFWRLDQRRKAIEGDMRATFQTAFPQATAIVDPALQMERNLATLKRERGLAYENESKQALAHFAKLTKSAPDLTISEVRVANNAATLQGKANSETQLAALERAVAQIPAAKFENSSSQIVVTLPIVATRAGK